LTIYELSNTITGITTHWRYNMRVTTKGQVTIPQHIREKLGIVPATDIEFVEEKDRVYIVKKNEPGKGNNKFRKLRGVATVRMTTDEIMALTRKDE
jgi:AbrB family looped-hinge helix DNA binding protein